MMGPYNLKKNFFFGQNWVNKTSTEFSSEKKLEPFFLMNLNHDKNRFFVMLSSSSNYRI